MKNFIKKHGAHLGVLAALIIIAGASGYYTYREPPGIISATSSTIAVTLSVEPTVATAFEVPADATVFTLMEAAQNSGQLSFRAKDFGGGLGVFIEEINGRTNTSEQFWIYYINNQKAQTGVSNYTLRTGDLIEWKYETAEF